MAAAVRVHKVAVGQVHQRLREEVLVPRRAHHLVDEEIVDVVRPRRGREAHIAYLHRARLQREHFVARPLRVPVEVHQHLDAVLVAAPRDLRHRHLRTEVLHLLRDAPLPLGAVGTRKGVAKHLQLTSVVEAKDGHHEVRQRVIAKVGAHVAHAQPLAPREVDHSRRRMHEGLGKGLASVDTAVRATPAAPHDEGAIHRVGHRVEGLYRGLVTPHYLPVHRLLQPREPLVAHRPVAHTLQRVDLQRPAPAQGHAKANEPLFRWGGWKPYHVAESVGEVRAQLQRLAVVHDGLVVAARVLVNTGQVHVQFRDAWVQGDRLLVRDDGLVHKAHVFEQRGALRGDVHLRRIQGDRLRVVHEGLLQAALLLAKLRKGLVRARVVGCQADRRQEARGGLIPGPKRCVLLPRHDSARVSSRAHLARGQPKEAPRCLPRTHSAWRLRRSTCRPGRSVQHSSTAWPVPATRRPRRGALQGPTHHMPRQSSSVTTHVQAVTARFFAHLHKALARAFVLVEAEVQVAQVLVQVSIVWIELERRLKATRCSIVEPALRVHKAQADVRVHERGIELDGLLVVVDAQLDVPARLEGVRQVGVRLGHARVLRDDVHVERHAALKVPQAVGGRGQQQLHVRRHAAGRVHQPRQHLLGLDRGRRVLPRQVQLVRLLARRVLCLPPRLRGARRPQLRQMLRRRRRRLLLWMGRNIVRRRRWRSGHQVPREGPDHVRLRLEVGGAQRLWPTAAGDHEPLQLLAQGGVVNDGHVGIPAPAAAAAAAAVAVAASLAVAAAPVSAAAALLAGGRATPAPGAQPAPHLVASGAPAVAAGAAALGGWQASAGAGGGAEAAPACWPDWGIGGRARRGRAMAAASWCSRRSSASR
eukprot:scaffold685_cov324-Prasinococcus_capsulatus_cf.AAC.10